MSGEDQQGGLAAGQSHQVVGLATLHDGFEQAFDRWELVEQATSSGPPTERTFIPLFEVLEWAACVDERWGKLDWSKDLRGLRLARNRTRHDWAMALEVRSRNELRLPKNVVLESVPPFVWAWREELPEAKPIPARFRDDEVYYQEKLAGHAARVTLYLVRAFFRDLRAHSVPRF